MMDAALIDTVEHAFHRGDVANNLRAQIEGGKPMARLPEIAQALGVTLDALLEEFLDAIFERSGERYEVVGIQLKARVN